MQHLMDPINPMKPLTLVNRNRHGDSVAPRITRNDIEVVRAVSCVAMKVGNVLHSS
jgi:hypothetical protein